MLCKYCKNPVPFQGSCYTSGCPNNFFKGLEDSFGLLESIHRDRTTQKIEVLSRRESFERSFINEENRQFFVETEKQHLGMAYKAGTATQFSGRNFTRDGVTGNCTVSAILCAFARDREIKRKPLLDCRFNLNSEGFNALGIRDASLALIRLNGSRHVDFDRGELSTLNFYIDNHFVFDLNLLENQLPSVLAHVYVRKKGQIDQGRSSLALTLGHRFFYVIQSESARHTVYFEARPNGGNKFWRFYDGRYQGMFSPAYDPVSCFDCGAENGELAVKSYKHYKGYYEIEDFMEMIYVIK